MSAFFPLTNEEMERLKRLNQDETIIFALKKLFLNTCMQKPDTVDGWASQRAAQEYIRQAFHELNTLQLRISERREEENLI